MTMKNFEFATAKLLGFKEVVKKGIYEIPENVTTSDIKNFPIKERFLKIPPSLLLKEENFQRVNNNWLAEQGFNRVYATPPLNPLDLIISNGYYEVTIDTNNYYIRVKTTWPGSKYPITILDITSAMQKYGNQIVIAYNNRNNALKVFWCYLETLEYKKYTEKLKRYLIANFSVNKKEYYNYLQRKEEEERKRKEEEERERKAKEERKRKEEERKRKEEEERKRKEEAKLYQKHIDIHWSYNEYRPTDKRWKKEYSYVNNYMSEDIKAAIIDAGFDIEDIKF